MGMAIVEAKIKNQLSYIKKNPLFQIFIGLIKYYDEMEIRQWMDIMKDYEFSTTGHANILSPRWEDGL